jgi:DNA polymerase-3 subunit gamma/tau
MTQQQQEMTGPTELHLKHRPRRLEKVVGNDAVKVSLARLIETKRIPHAIGFFGESGTGKTTLARILADALGCASFDFKEYNAGNARGIDNIRKDILSGASLAPMAGPVRVWLIDEVDGLTKEAQMSLKKILEDTPKHIYFFLCTTLPNKLDRQLLTRLHPVNLELLSEDKLIGLAKRIAGKENIVLSDPTLKLLAEGAGGSARMLLVLLEKIGSLPEGAEREAAIKLEVERQNEAIDLCKALVARKGWPEIARILRNLKGDAERTRRAVLGYACACLLNSRDAADGYRIYNVICAFEADFFASGNAGLARACYEAVTQGK